MARKIIIDTDPGQDDAVAILLALASPDELDVLGITAVAGNVPLSLTERNARMVCELAGRTDVPVHAGASRPMVRPPITAEYIHGDTGIDGAGLDEPTAPLASTDAVGFIIDTITSHDPGEVTLCTLGPMTNVALALVLEPSIAPRVREVVAMGGGFFEGGNRTPAAEFNILADPHAAAAVFESGIPITLMPLDVTHRALITPERLAALATIDTPVGRSVAGMLDFYERFDIEKYGSEGGPLHDPCVIAYLLRPELFGGRRCNVRIETMSELTIGMTVVDWWHVTDLAENALVMREVDADGFFALIAERIARL